MSDVTYLGRADVVASDIGENWALLDLETSLYYTLNATGAEVWNAMKTPASLEQLVEAVTHAFDVSEAQCRADVEALVEDLVSTGLASKKTAQEHAQA